MSQRYSDEIILTRERKAYLERAIANLQKKPQPTVGEVLWINLYKRELEVGVSVDDWS